MTLPNALLELKELPQWVGFSLNWDNKKQKNSKRPICPVHNVLQYKKDIAANKPPEDKYGKSAMADNPQSWGTYSQALQLVTEKSYVSGVGFEFANGYAGIDIDHCIDQNGNISPMAAAIIEAMDSYTELSPSRTGIHILFKTSIPPFKGIRNDNIGLEIYNSGRYFTITGNVYGTEKPINERTERLHTVIEQFCPRAAMNPQQEGVYNTVGASRSTAEIWNRAFNSKNGSLIRDLYDGKIPDYLQNGEEGQSRADLALCSYLAYWTNGDRYMMDKMFRESGLYREKWEREDYRDMTMNKALNGFTPYEKHDNQSNTWNNDLQSNTWPAWGTYETETVIAADERLEHETHPQTALRVRFEENGQPDSIEDYANNLFADELEKFRKSANRKTGFKYLDAEIGSLYPGLYTVGAISSLGKTTFLHQIADQLAEDGEHVLFFSLEQSRLELFSKGVARQSLREAWGAHRNENYEQVKYYAVSAIKVRSGKYNDRVIDLPELTRRYAQVHGNVSIIECGFDTKISDITGYVEKYIEVNQVKPIVIIDYLQIIQPDDPRQLKRDAVDGHIRALKMLQKDNDLIMFLICSINRSAYLYPVDFESFKETGGIEYTSDVVWGLDLHVMETNDIFDKQENKKQKRELIKAAKLEVPRKVDLKCLKNRYGKSSYTVRFNYYPENDYFEDINPASADFAIDTGNPMRWA